LLRGLGAEQAYSFNSGGITSPNSSGELFIEYLAEEKLSGTTFSLLIEDSWMKKSDALKHHSDASLYFVNDTPYYLIEGREFNANRLEATIKLTSSWMFIGFVSHMVLTEADSIDRVFTTEAVGSFVAQCKVIFVSAYDREGFVIWRR
jgi:hypothetical protein